MSDQRREDGPLERVLALLEGVRSQAGGYRALCPVHGDHNPSLSVREGEDGRVLLHCHAGCTTETILDALGLEWADLFADGKPNASTPEAVYVYTDDEGEPLFEVVRFAGKQFVQRRPNADKPGEYVWDRKGVKPVLYRLPEVLAAARANKTVYIVEGERDVEALEHVGATATCNPGGAGKWRAEYSEALRGAQVIVVADLDEPGQSHAAQVAAELAGVAASVEVVVPAAGKDAADHLAAGHGVTEFRPVDAATGQELGMLLDEIAVFVRRFVVLTEEQLTAISLWIAHTHAFAAADTTPYLQISSAEKESGKTRLLETLELVVARPWLTGRMSISALARKIDAEQPTLLLDESDALFASDKTYVQDLRGILNCGFRRGGSHTINIAVGQNGWSPTNFSVFSAKAIAGIGDLPDTIASRSISIRLQRRRDDEPVERFRNRHVQKLAQPLRERLEQLLPRCVAALIDIIDAEPPMPPGLSDRAEDVWEPLLAIADLAGGTWPKQARQAAVELSTRGNDGETSIGVRLLGDIRAIFHKRAIDQISSTELAFALCAIEESPWGSWGYGKGLTTHALAKQLKGFAIAPRHTRDGSARGYSRHQFDEAFSRYLPPLTQGTVKPSALHACEPRRETTSDALTLSSDTLDNAPKPPSPPNDPEDDGYADREHERITHKFPEFLEEDGK